MTLKNKFAGTFTLITSCILIGVCCLIYFFFQKYTNNVFYERLYERAKIVAFYLLEKDELSQKVFSNIRREYQQVLPLEEEYLLNLEDPASRDTMPAFIDEGFIKAIEKRGHAGKRYGQAWVAGIYYTDNQGDFAVIISARDQSGAEQLRSLRRILVMAILGSLALVFILGRWYAEEMLAPLKDIIQRMHAIDTHNLHLRIAVPEKQDELNQLAQAFNKLLNRIETAVESQNNFVNHASHELKTPLTTILGEVEIGLKGERSVEEYRHCLGQVKTEAERLKNLSIRLLHLARVGVSEGGKTFALLRPDELLLEVVETLNQSQAELGISLHFEGLPEDSRELETRANANLLKIALANVIGNAIKFSAGRPVEVFFINRASEFEIGVMDQGIGIPPQSLPCIFNPFFRAENARPIEGYGLGLSLVRKIVEIHDGKIEVQSEVGKGTTISIKLPKQQF